MSYDYMEKLDSSSKARYQAKLNAVGLPKCPFQLPGDTSCTWIDDMTIPDDDMAGRRIRRHLHVLKGQHK